MCDKTKPMSKFILPLFVLFILLSTGCESSSLQEHLYDVQADSARLVTQVAELSWRLAQADVDYDAMMNAKDTVIANLHKEVTFYQQELEERTDFTTP